MGISEKEGNQNGIRHIAFIMDGNGSGHSAGAKKFKEIVRHCADRGIDYVTVYAFSTENWKRPKKEVNTIMKLFRDYIKEAERDFGKNDVRVIFIGNRNVFDATLRREMETIERLTASRSKTLCIAINYGGRGEIVDAVNSLIESGRKTVTEEDITGSIYSGVVPPPDLIVRTGGEMRLSNFLLWQSAYSELFFSDTLWPDFTTEEVDVILEEFRQRNRRYGGI